MKTRVKWILGIGIPFGLILVFFKNIWEIEDGVFWKGYLIMAAVVIAGAVILNCLYQIRFVKRMKTVNELITKQKDFELFFEATNKLIQGTRGEARKSLLRINLSWGYAKAGRYEEGLKVLQSAKPQKIGTLNRTIYYLNLSYFHFYLNQYQEVIAITEEQENEFKKLKEHGQLGGSVAANEIYYSIATGKLEHARELLEEAKQRWVNEKTAEEWILIEEKLVEKEGEQ